MTTTTEQTAPKPNRARRRVVGILVAGVAVAALAAPVVHDLNTNDTAPVEALGKVRCC